MLVWNAKGIWRENVIIHIKPKQNLVLNVMQIMYVNRRERQLLRGPNRTEELTLKKTTILTKIH